MRGILVRIAVPCHLYYNPPQFRYNPPSGAVARFPLRLLLSTHPNLSPAYVQWAGRLGKWIRYLFSDPQSNGPRVFQLPWSLLFFLVNLLV